MLFAFGLPCLCCASAQSSTVRAMGLGLSLGVMKSSFFPRFRRAPSVLGRAPWGPPCTSPAHVLQCAPACPPLPEPGSPSSRGRKGQGETNPLPLPLPRPRPLLYPLPTATRTPATQCPPGLTEWRGRGRNWAGGKGRTKEGNRTGQTALAENGAELRRRRRKGKTGKNHCGC